MTILIQTRPSNGARSLAAAINAENIRCLRRRPSSRRHPSSRSFLVNWGVSDGEYDPHLNKYVAVHTAVNKLATLNTLDNQQVRVPEFRYTGAGDRPESNTSEHIWFARQTLTGSGGEGIVVVRPGETFPAAPLLVKYIPKLVEFRVHAFRILNETKFLVRQKLRKSDAEQTRDQRLIRNHDNGWVFGLVRDEDGAAKAAEEAAKAVQVLGLDFGAVDVIIGRDDGLPYVLEVNTAPGLEAEEVINFYRDNIISAYNTWRNG